MLTIKWIPNMEQFLVKLAAIDGEVVLHFQDNTSCDLKRNSSVQQTLKMIKPGQTGLNISLSNSAQVSEVLKCMMGA